MDGLRGKGCIYAGSEGCEELGRKDEEPEKRVGRRSLRWSSWSERNYEVWVAMGAVSAPSVQSLFLLAPFQMLYKKIWPEHLPHKEETKLATERSELSRDTGLRAS